MEKATGALYKNLWVLYILLSVVTNRVLLAYPDWVLEDCGSSDPHLSLPAQVLPLSQSHSNLLKQRHIRERQDASEPSESLSSRRWAAGKVFLVFWKLQGGQLEPNAIMSSLEKHKFARKVKVSETTTGSTSKGKGQCFTFRHGIQERFFFFSLLCRTFKLLWNDKSEKTDLTHAFVASSFQYQTKLLQHN